MSVAQFYTFLTGGLGLLVALMTLVAWHLWRMREDSRAGRQSALEGVSHELRINLQRMISELSQVAANPGVGPDVLLPIRYPQLDGVNRALINTNRHGLAVVGVTYQELEARKLSLRAQLAQAREPGAVLDDAMDATINGIAALYLWEVHKGALPSTVGRVRSWDVRDWMKGHAFRSDAFPNMHLRDEVVERLRMYGLELTPKPLTHTAWEYYSMQYDRHADVRGPLGRRRIQDDAEDAAETGDETEAAPGEEKPRRSLFGFGRKEEAEAEVAVETEEEVAFEEAPGETVEGEVLGPEAETVGADEYKPSN